MMKLVLHTAVVPPHQFLLAHEIARRLGADDFRYLYTDELPSESCKLGRTEFCTEVQHERLVDYCRFLELFVLPSGFESFGCGYMELWACGAQFFATSGAGVVELISPEDRHLWVAKPHDVDDLVDKIAYCRYWTHQRLAAHISIDQITKRFVNEIEELRGKL